MVTNVTKSFGARDGPGSRTERQHDQVGKTRGVRKVLRTYGLPWVLVSCAGVAWSPIQLTSLLSLSIGGAGTVLAPVWN